jgi:hypothetical protein
LFLPERLGHGIIGLYPLNARNACTCNRDAKERRIELEGSMMNPDPDPFEQGERAARQNIPAEANPYQDGSEQHSLWAAGHEKIAGAREAGESEDR